VVARVLDQPNWGPTAIAVATTGLFHLVVALLRPEYWGSQSTWDEGFYVGIALHGYELPDGDFGQPTRLPFSPGYPLLLRAAAWLSGIHPQFLRPALGAILFVVGCLGLGYALRAFSSEHRRNNLAILVFSVWPGSLYFRSGYAEALYLPLVAFCFGAMLRRRFLAAACLAAACWFTRTPAVVVVLTLAASIVIDALRRHETRRAVFAALRTLAWAMPIACVGLAGYMAILYRSVGDPFAFVSAYVNWEPCEVLSWRTLKLKTPVAATLLFSDRPTIKLAVAVFLATPVLIALQRKKMPVELSLFTAFAWVFFLANDATLDPFCDMMRWMAIAFPVHYAIVLAFEGLRPSFRRWALPLWLVSSTCAYLWCVSRYVCNEWVS
jgi:hypothetical protein